MNSVIFAIAFSPLDKIAAMLLLVGFLLIFGPRSIDDDPSKPRFHSFRFYLSSQSASGPNHSVYFALVVFVVAVMLGLLIGLVA